MSMLGEQIKELRKAARNMQGKLGRCLYRRKDVDEMQQVSSLLLEAADTLEKLEPHSYQLEPSRWHELFGTPERAARTLENGTPMCDWCDTQACDKRGGECSLFDYNVLLEWLRGESE